MFGGREIFSLNLKLILTRCKTSYVWYNLQSQYVPGRGDSAMFPTLCHFFLLPLHFLLCLLTPLPQMLREYKRKKSSCLVVIGMQSQCRLMKMFAVNAKTP